MNGAYFTKGTIAAFVLAAALHFGAELITAKPIYYFGVRALGWSIFVFVIGYKTCLISKQHKVVCDIGGYLGGFFTIIGVLVAIDAAAGQKGGTLASQIGILSDRFRELYLFGLPEALGAVFGLGIAKRIHDFRTS